MPTPTIYYFIQMPKKPFGGVRVIYRHVDILNQLGFHAFVVHQKRWFRKNRCDWFKNQTPIITVKKLAHLNLKENDFIVFPEIYGPNTAKLIKCENKIIFNQGAFCTFRGGYDLTPSNLQTPYTDPTIKAVITVSENSKDYLSYVFPKLKIFRTHNSIDDSLFYFSQQKKKQIAFMPRKSHRDLIQIINILKFRHALKDYKLIPIDNRSEQEVAQILRESLIFLCSGANEGFQLPPAEALACGCITIGYHGQGAKEFLSPKFSFPIEAGYIIEFAKTVEKVIKEYEQDPAKLDEYRKEGSKYILSQYSIKQEQQDLLYIWQTIYKNFIMAL